MRIAYLDESGIGNIKQDPVVVVAGVLVHADTQWFRIEQRLEYIRQNFVPKDKRNGLIFHAKDIYHGTNQFSREEWDKDLRLSILDELVKIPGDFNLPVLWGICDRSMPSTVLPKGPAQDHLAMSYVHAATWAIMHAEYFMRLHQAEVEVFSITMENNNILRKSLKSWHKYLRYNLPQFGPYVDAGYLPLTHCIDTPHFAEKDECSPLQVADACAFVIKRKEAKARDWDRFYPPLRDQCAVLRKDEIPLVQVKGRTYRD